MGSSPRVLVVNSGRLAEAPARRAHDGTVVAKGIVEKIGEPGGVLTTRPCCARRSRRCGLDNPEIFAVGHRTPAGRLRRSSRRRRRRREDPRADPRPAAQPRERARYRGGAVVAARAARRRSTPRSSTPCPRRPRRTRSTPGAREHGIRYGFHGTAPVRRARRAELVGRPVEEIDQIVPPRQRRAGLGGQGCRGRDVDGPHAARGSSWHPLGRRRRRDRVPPRTAGMGVDELDELLNRAWHQGSRASIGELPAHRGGPEEARLALDVYLHRCAGPGHCGAGGVDVIVHRGRRGERRRVKTGALAGPSGWDWATPPATPSG